MTAKLQAIITAWIAGVSSFIAWLVSMPPENQDALIKPLIELCPINWRPAVGFVSRLLATASIIYGAYKTAHHAQPPPAPTAPK